jgi:hypothetical protein
MSLKDQIAGGGLAGRKLRPALAQILLAAGLLAWTPAPRDTPVQLHIMTPERFEAHRLLTGLPPGARAFALLEPDGHCAIYLTPRSVQMIWHELRHCQDGAWHE